MIKCKIKSCGSVISDSFVEPDISYRSNKSNYKQILDITPHSNYDMDKYTYEISTLNSRIYDQELFYKKKLADMATQSQSNVDHYTSQINALREQIQEIRGKASMENHISERFATDIINRDVEIAKLKQTITGLENTITANTHISKLRSEKEIMSRDANHRVEMTQTKKELEEKVRKLEDKLQSTIQESRNKLDGAYKELAQKYETAISAVKEDLSAKLAVAENDVVYLKREKDMAVAEITNKYKSLENEMGFIQLRYDQLSATHDTLRTNSEMEYNQLKQEKLEAGSRHKHDFNEVNTKLKELYRVHEEALQKHNAIREELNIAQESRNRAISDLNIQLRQLKQQNQYLNEIYDKAVKDADKELQDKLMAKEAVITELKSAATELIATKESNVSLQGTVHKLRNQHMSAVHELDKLKKDYDILQEEHEFVAGRFTSLDSQIRDITAKNCALTKLNTEFKTKNKDLDEKHNELFTANRDLNNRLVLLNANYDNLIASKHDSTKDEHDIIAHLTKELHNLDVIRQERDTLNNTLSAKDQHLQNYEFRYNKIKEDWNKFQVRYNTVSDEVVLLKSQLKECRTQIEYQSQSVENKESKINQLQLSINKSQYSLVAIKKEMEHVQSTKDMFEQTAIERLNVISKLTEKVQGLETEYTRIKTENGVGAQTIMDLKDINGSLAQTIHGKERTVNTLNDKLVLLTGQLNNLQLDYTDLKKRNDELDLVGITMFKNHSLELNKNVQTISNLTDSIDKLKSENKNLIALKQDSESKQSRINQLEQAVAMHVEYNKKADNKYNSLVLDTRREITRLTAQILQLETDLCTVKASSGNLKDLKQEYDSLCEDHQTALKAIRDNSKLATNHQLLSDKYHSLFQQLETKTSALTELQILYTKTEGQRDHYYALSHNLKDINTEHEILKVTYAKLNSTYTELKHLLQTTQNDLGRMSTDNSNLEKEYALFKQTTEKNRCKYLTDLSLLKQTVIEARQYVSEHKMTVKTLQQEITSLNSDLGHRKHILDSYDTLCIAHKNLACERDQLVCGIEDLTSKYNTTEKLNKKLCDDIANATKVAIHLKATSKKQYDNTSDTINNLNLQIKSISNTNILLLEKIDLYECKIYDLEQTHKSNETIQSQLAIMTTNYNALDLKHSDTLNQMYYYRTQYNTLFEEKTTYDRNTESLQTRLNELSISQKNLLKQLADVSSKYDILTKEHTTLSVKYTNMSAKSAILQETFDDMATQVGNLQKTNRDLCEKLSLSPTIEQHRSLNDTIRKLNDDKTNFQTQIQRLLTAQDESKIAYNKLKDTVKSADTLTNEIHRLNNIVNDLKKDIVKHHNEIRTLSESNQALRHDKTELSGVIESLETKIEALHKLPDKLNTKLSKLRTESQKLLREYTLREKELLLVIRDKDVQLGLQ